MSTRAANTGAQGRVGFSPNATGATLPGGMGFNPNASTGSFDVNLNATNLQQTGSTQFGADVGKRGGDGGFGVPLESVEVMLPSVPAPYKLQVPAPATLGGVREKLSYTGEHLFTNKKKLDYFGSRADKPIVIPQACIALFATVSTNNPYDPAETAEKELGPEFDHAPLAKLTLGGALRVTARRRSVPLPAATGPGKDASTQANNWPGKEQGKPKPFRIRDITNCPIPEIERLFQDPELDLRQARVHLYQHMTEEMLNLIDDDGVSLLTRLIKAGKVDAALALLEDVRFKRMDTPPADASNVSALMLACSRGQEEVALGILAREDFSALNGVTFEGLWRKKVTQGGEVEPTCVTDGGFTALELAIRNGLETVALAIVERADFQCVNNVSPGKYTSLMCAIAADLPEVAFGILARPDFTEVSKRNNQQIECTAYQMAAKKAVPSDKVLKFMIAGPQKNALLERHELFGQLSQEIQRHPRFRMDVRNAFTKP